MKGTLSGSAVLQIETNTLLKLCDLLKSLILFYLRREASRMWEKSDITDWGVISLQSEVD